MTMIDYFFVRMEGNALRGLEEGNYNECFVITGIHEYNNKVATDYSNIKIRAYESGDILKSYRMVMKNKQSIVVKVPLKDLSYLTYLLIEVHDTTFSNDNDTLSFKWNINDGLAGWIQSTGVIPTIDSNYVYNTSGWLGIDTGNDLHNKMTYLEFNPIGGTYNRFYVRFGLNLTNFQAQNGTELPMFNIWYNYANFGHIGFSGNGTSGTSAYLTTMLQNGRTIFKTLTTDISKEAQRVAVGSDQNDLLLETANWSSTSQIARQGGTFFVISNDGHQPQVRGLYIMEAPNQCRGTYFTQTFLDHVITDENKIFRRIETKLSLTASSQQLTDIKNLATSKNDPYHRIPIKLNQAQSNELRHNLRNLRCRVNGKEVEYYAGKQEQRNMWAILAIPNEALANEMNIVIDIMGTERNTPINWNIFKGLIDFRLNNVDISYVKHI